MDVLVAPATTVDAPLLERGQGGGGLGARNWTSVAALTRFTRYFNLAATPVLTLALRA